jgi:hypothetical protein
VSDVFISYKREDIQHARTVAVALGKEGHSAFYDLGEMGINPGEAWDKRLEYELESCACCIVLWSPGSIFSDNVRSEVGRAKAKNILIPAIIARCEPPLGLDTLQSVDLTAWNGDIEAQNWQLVVDRGISRKLQPRSEINEKSKELPTEFQEGPIFDPQSTTVPEPVQLPPCPLNQDTTTLKAAYTNKDESGATPTYLEIVPIRSDKSHSHLIYLISFILVACLSWTIYLSQVVSEFDFFLGWVIINISMISGILLIVMVLPLFLEKRSIRLDPLGLHLKSNLEVKTFPWDTVRDLRFGKWMIKGETDVGPLEILSQAYPSKPPLELFGLLKLFKERHGS